jgi:ABC-type tungstate transport system substrate-binding protein
MKAPLAKREPWKAQSVPDALIAWTSGAALVSFGLMFLDDAVIMGHTLLTLGLLIVVNEALKLHASFTRAAHGHEKLRLAVAIVFVALVVYGFVFPSPH